MNALHSSGVIDMGTPSNTEYGAGSPLQRTNGGIGFGETPWLRVTHLRTLRDLTEAGEDIVAELK